MLAKLTSNDFDILAAELKLGRFPFMLFASLLADLLGSTIRVMA